MKKLMLMLVIAFTMLGLAPSPASAEFMHAWTDWKVNFYSGKNTAGDDYSSTVVNYRTEKVWIFRNGTATVHWKLIGRQYDESFQNSCSIRIQRRTFPTGITQGWQTMKYARTVDIQTKSGSFKISWPSPGLHNKFRVRLAHNMYARKEPTLLPGWDEHNYINGITTVRVCHAIVNITR